MRALRIAAYIALVVIVLLASACIIVFGIISGSENGNPEANMLFFDISIYAAYALLLIACTAAFVFPVIHLFRNISRSKRSLIGIAAFVIIFFILYLVSPEYTGDFYTRNGIGPGESRLINAGIISVYFFMIITIIVLVYDEIAKRIK
jgi:hypothetical protein